MFLGQVCPGMVFDTVGDWVQIYSSAGLTDVETQTGPFEMMTPRGYLAGVSDDHGFLRSAPVAGLTSFSW